jgi:uncharacterized protein YbdZ (MbtH family)
MPANIGWGAIVNIRIISTLIIACAALAGAPQPALAAPSHTVLQVASERDDEQTYIVIVNHEGRRSIWPDGRELPAGWSAEGFSGTRQECLNYIRGG